MHLQCYDLSGYLLVSRSTKAFNSRWRCPQCHLTVLPSDLQVDCFFQHLLAQTKEEDIEVELQAVSWPSHLLNTKTLGYGLRAKDLGYGL